MELIRRQICESAGTGRQARLRGVCQPTWEFKSPLSHQLVGASFISLAPAFYAYGKKVRVRSFRCSSSQTRTHFVGLRVCVLWSSLCDRAFYFTGNRKHHPLRSLAPPFQIEPVLCTGLRFGFLCPKLKNMLLLFEQASYRLLRLFMPMAKKVRVRSFRCSSSQTRTR